MAGDGVVRIAELHCEPADLIYINIVRVPVAVPVIGKFRAFNQDMAGGIVRREYPVFVVVDVASTDGQAGTNLKNGSGVVIRSGCAGKLYILDGCVIAGYRPDRAPAKCLACSVDNGPAVHADDR